MIAIAIAIQDHALTRRTETAKNLALIEGGGDVFSYRLAMEYRRLSGQISPLVKICKSRGKTLGMARKPYFGAKLTAYGKRFLRDARANGIAPNA